MFVIGVRLRRYCLAALGHCEIDRAAPRLAAQAAVHGDIDVEQQVHGSAILSQYKGVEPLLLLIAQLRQLVVRDHSDPIQRSGVRSGLRQVIRRKASVEFDRAVQTPEAGIGFFSKA